MAKFKVVLSTAAGASAGAPAISEAEALVLRLQEQLAATLAQGSTGARRGAEMGNPAMLHSKSKIGACRVLKTRKTAPQKTQMDGIAPEFESGEGGTDWRPLLGAGYSAAEHRAAVSDASAESKLRFLVKGMLDIHNSMWSLAQMSMVRGLLMRIGEWPDGK